MMIRFPISNASAVVGALLFSSLAATGLQGQDAPPEPAAAYHAPTDPGELLKIDEPMRHFFGERLRPYRQGGDQLRALLDSVFQPNGLNFTYDGAGTFAARETFRQRRGNCVSFAFLVVAVAREFGFHASFQDVPTPERWDRSGNLIISIRHINVRIETGDETYLVDLRPDLAADTGTADMQVIRDERAFAQFYDTSGVYELLHGDSAAALRYMTLATTTDPSFASAWSNQASVHTRLGNLAEARACYERSLRADPRYLFALDGYVDVLRRLGSPEALKVAEKYEHRAQAIRERNPYYLQRLAERAQEQGDWAAAEKLLRRAIGLKDNEPQFYEEWATVLRHLGRDDAARRAAAKLEKLQQQLTPTPAHIAP
jgi:tetratricopeptide (TPR) repeat protein